MTGQRGAATAERSQRADASRRAKRQQAEYERGRADGAAGRPSSPPDAAYLVMPYDVGYDEGVANPDTGTSSSTSSSKSTRSSSKRKTRAGSTGSARRRRRRAPSTRAAARRVAGPAQRQAANGMALLGMVLMLTLAYQFLQHADLVAGALDGANRALLWLREPRPIPYRHE